MRKLAILILLFPSLVFADGMQVKRKNISASVGCPSADLVAWDGDYSVGGADTDKACLSGTPTDGTNTGGAFGSDSGTIWTQNADNDRLSWSVTDADIDHDAAAGFTLCSEFKTADVTANQVIVEFEGDGNDNAYIRITSTEKITCGYNGNNGASTGGVSSTTSITADSSTYNSVCCSWKVGEAGNDVAVSVDGGATYEVEDDDDLVAWAAAESDIKLGCLFVPCSTDVTATRQFVARTGYKQADTW